MISEYSYIREREWKKIAFCIFNFLGAGGVFKGKIYYQGLESDLFEMLEEMLFVFFLGMGFLWGLLVGDSGLFLNI